MGTSIPITVMQFGRDDETVRQTMADLNKMCSLLSAEDLMPSGLLEPVPYADCVSQNTTCVVSELAALAMTDVVDATIVLRAHIFSVLAKCKMASADDFIEQMRGFVEGNHLICNIGNDSLAALYEQAMFVRRRHDLEAPFDPPDILWLPVVHHPRFDGGHGVSDLVFHFGGSCTLLCPPAYYFQILWHECFHLLVGANDCYEWSSRRRTCDLPNCVMQWNPCYSDPANGRWLCGNQQQAVRDGVQRLLRRKEKLVQDQNNRAGK